MLTITEQDEEFGSSDETDSDDSDEVSEPPPTPMNLQEMIPESKGEARERLQATRHLMMEDMMITIYQYLSKIYQPDNMLTIMEQDEEFGSSDETNSDDSDEANEPLPTPMNSQEIIPESKEL
ncbi:hypothetical protein A7U60_g839 [Sanghuangporus baumii]|uniref:Uncharacterized protein n=1 Tax=Sanghuangporus baumii TaxID=108892 RepID=A0A9Q5I5J1_SANBA|nr:hypothetical protein A7U60_g839 [Sanghuangporus baumii]